MSRLAMLYRTVSKYLLEICLFPPICLSEIPRPSLSVNDDVEKAPYVSDRHMEAVTAPLRRYSNPIHVYNLDPCSLYNLCHTLALATLIKRRVYISLMAEGSVSAGSHQFRLLLFFPG